MPISHTPTRNLREGFDIFFLAVRYSVLNTIMRVCFHHSLRFPIETSQWKEMFHGLYSFTYSPGEVEKEANSITREETARTSLLQLISKAVSELEDMFDLEQDRDDSESLVELCLW